MSHRVSVMICTRNRADHLAGTLASISKCPTPQDVDLDLIVIDNASTDDTPRVVAEARQKDSRIRHVREEALGLSRARNRGLTEAAGEVLVFTDDDVRVPSDWIERMCRPILDGTADVVAGSVKMATHLNRPWMGPFHRAWLAEADLSRTAKPSGIIGANFSFSRKVLEKIPEFDVRVGSGALGFCEDNLWGAQVVAAGFRIANSGNCSVEHHFLADRLSRENLLSRAWKQGQSGAHMAYHWAHRPVKLVWGRVIFWWAALTLNRMRYLLRKPDPEGAPEWELSYLEKLAYNLHYTRLRRVPHHYEQFGLRPAIR